MTLATQGWSFETASCKNLIQRREIQPQLNLWLLSRSPSISTRCSVGVPVERIVDRVIDAAAKSLAYKPLAHRSKINDFSARNRKNTPRGSNKVGM
jgi:hypothetical protein